MGLRRTMQKHGGPAFRRPPFLYLVSVPRQFSVVCRSGPRPFVDSFDGIVPTAVEFGLSATAVVIETVRVLVLSHHRIRGDWGGYPDSGPSFRVIQESRVAPVLRAEWRQLSGVLG